MSRISYSDGLVRGWAALRRSCGLIKPKRFSPAEESLFAQVSADRAYRQAKYGLALSVSVWVSLWVFGGLTHGFEGRTGLGHILYAGVAALLAGVWWFGVNHAERFKARMWSHLALAYGAAILGVALAMMANASVRPGAAFQQGWPVYVGLIFSAMPRGGLALRCRGLAGRVVG